MSEKAEKRIDKPGTLWLTGRIQSTQQVGTDKDVYLSHDGQMIPFSAVEVSSNG